MRPRDWDIPEIFYRLYSLSSEEEVLHWCRDFLSEKMEVSFSPRRQDVHSARPSQALTSYLLSLTGKIKMDGLANSGDLVMVYGSLQSSPDSTKRFAHVWWLSGKSIVRFEEF
jgi:hypothetical protein